MLESLATIWLILQIAGIVIPLILGLVLSVIYLVATLEEKRRLRK